MPSSEVKRVSVYEKYTGPAKVPGIREDYERRGRLERPVSRDYDVQSNCHFFIT